MSTIEIITERLILRHPTMDDAVIINDAKKAVWPELQKWMTWAHDGQETLESTKNFIRDIGNTSLIGLCRKSGEFVVSTGLLPFEKPDEYVTGYWVAQDFLGKGYATEATCAAIRYAFEVLSARKIHIGYYENNVKSRRIIEKLGFSNEIVLPKSRKAIIHDGWDDAHDFTMTDPSVLPQMECEWRGRW